MQVSRDLTAMKAMEANLLSIDVIDFTQGYESEDITDPYPAGDIWFRVGFYGECAGIELTRPR